MSDLDSLLDTKLDDLADLPAFAVFPRGTHSVKASFEMKEINAKAAVELSFTMVETLELSDPQDAKPNGGDVSNTMFMLGNEYGVGNLKKCAKPFQEALQLETIRDVIEQVKDVECVITTSLRADKKDKEKFYLEVKDITII